MELHLRRERYTGRYVLRPNCDFSRFICEIMGRKSVSETMMSVLKKYGHTITILDK
jgi:hypothetical protein